MTTTPNPTDAAIHDAAHEVYVSVVAQLDDMSDEVAQHLLDLDGDDRTEAEAAIEDLLGTLRASAEQRFSDWKCDRGL